MGIRTALVSRNGPVLCAERVDFYAKNDPVLATFDTTPSPHWRINAASLILAFAHIHGEAGTSALGIWRARVGRNERSGSVSRRGAFHAKHPRSRYNRPHPVSALANHSSWFVRGLRPHPWRGGNTSFGHLECQGGSERSGSVCKRRGGLHMCKRTPHSLAPSTLPRLRSGESLQPDGVRPSPTSMARREH